MRVVLIYGLKTTDHQWAEAFYPVRRFIEECKNRSIPLRFLFADEVSVFLKENTDSQEKQETVCLLRGKIAGETFETLEDAGFICINSPKAHKLVADKLKTARFLQAHGWPTPNTMPMDAIGNDVSFPVVIKPRFGSRGKGVRLLESQAEFKTWIAKHRKEGKQASGNGCTAILGNWIFQEYIAGSHGRDLRVFFAGGHILAITERRTTTNSFISNIARGGHMYLYFYVNGLDQQKKIPETFRHIIQNIVQKSGLWYGTVDFLYTYPGGDWNQVCSGNTDYDTPDADILSGLTVCELNSSPGFEALETSCGINIAGCVIDQLLADFSAGSLLPTASSGLPRIIRSGTSTSCFR